MKFKEGNFYHIYNQGINYQNIFFRRNNYYYFLFKLRKYIRPFCEFIAYSLIPNQFQLLIYSVKSTTIHDLKGKNVLSEGFRMLLSSYAKGINKQENRRGSLFMQNTRCRYISPDDLAAGYCFQYIHQSPVRNQLVNKLSEWEFSSYKEFSERKDNGVCNRILTGKLLGIDNIDFEKYTNNFLSEEIIKRYFKNIEKNMPHFQNVPHLTYY